MKSMDFPRKSIWWIRKGIRLHDNKPLLEACKSNSLYPIFILDPMFTNPSIQSTSIENNAGTGVGRVGVNCFSFFLQSLEDLNQQLKKYNSKLFVLRGDPCNELPLFCTKYDITDVYYEYDSEPYAKIRDNKMKQILTKNNILFHGFSGHTLLPLSLYRSKNNGKVPLTYQSFLKIFQSLGQAPPKDLPAPTSIPPFDNCILQDIHKYNTPTLKELGYIESPTTDHKGGETEALKRFDLKLKDTQWVCSFEKPKTSPANFTNKSTTILSPYLTIGALSIRKLYHAIKTIYEKNKKHTIPPVSLNGQLLFREFFYLVASETENFHQMKDNIICKQIPWESCYHDIPDKIKIYFNAWANGKTGYPWIDAIMRQLRLEGWIHHLARHSVACFLTRGDLYLSWERGRALFDELLIDGDYSLNNANWLWLSASCFYSQYFRIYSPISFGKQYDKNGLYIKKYVKELRDFPSEYIYEPWKAPLPIQKKANCIIGKDYPNKIIEHDEARKDNLIRMKEAYENNKFIMSNHIKNKHSIERSSDKKRKKKN